jgi:hypothetical protein
LGRQDLGHPRSHAGRKSRFRIFAALFGKSLGDGGPAAKGATFDLIEQSVDALELKLQLLQFLTSRVPHNAHDLSLTEIKFPLAKT